MNTCKLRGLWFFGLWLLLPWPLIIFGDTWVPAVRYVILASAASAIAVTEGAAGPVIMIVGLFVGWALATTLLCLLLAWLVAKLLGWVPDRVATVLTLAVFSVALVIALFFEPYRTHFGRSATGGLLDILS